MPSLLETLDIKSQWAWLLWVSLIEGWSTGCCVRNKGKIVAAQCVANELNWTYAKTISALVQTILYLELEPFQLVFLHLWTWSPNQHPVHPTTDCIHACVWKRPSKGGGYSHVQEFLIYIYTYNTCTHTHTHSFFSMLFGQARWCEFPSFTASWHVQSFWITMWSLLGGSWGF